MATEDEAPRIAAHLAVAVVLAIVAGCVDAIGFDRAFGVFPSNQSGNAVLLGISLGQRAADDMWRPAVAIAGFGLGVMVAILLGSRAQRRRRRDLLVAVEIMLLVPLAVVAAASSEPVTTLDRGVVAALLVITACAMGIQTEAIGRIAGVSIATTYQSGAITHIAESAAVRFGSTTRRVRPGLTLLVVVVAAYIAGAVLGAAIQDWRWAMFVPVTILCVLAIVATNVAPDTPPEPDVGAA